MCYFFFDLFDNAHIYLSSPKKNEKNTHSFNSYNHFILELYVRLPRKYVE